MKRCGRVNLPIYDIVEMADILGLELERAKFLAACSHTDLGRAKDGVSSDRGHNIPYDESVLIKEAYRIGLGLFDTAVMMGMTPEEIMTYGHAFPEKSAFPPGNSMRKYCLWKTEVRPKKKRIRK